jgi:hypothetical protein
MSNRQTGKCRCGQVQFEVPLIPLITMVCHCTGCQRMTGSAFALSALYLSDDLRATFMDDARSFLPFLESYTDEMLPWAKTPAVRSFRKFPSPEQFPELLAEFAKRFAS